LESHFYFVVNKNPQTAFLANKKASKSLKDDFFSLEERGFLFYKMEKNASKGFPSIIFHKCKIGQFN
jgi:hypothetical protein